MAFLFVYRLAGKNLDDFFITFRYAQNLVQGNGFVFNTGDRVFGTTAPGFGLLLAAGHFLSRIPIEWLGTASTGVALVVIALTLLAEAGTQGHRREAWLGGTLLLTNTYIWGCHGAEAPVVLMLLLLAARFAERWPAFSGATAGYAVWCRPDAALGVGLLGLLLWSRRRRLPWRFGIAAAAIVALGAVAALGYFGAALPHTWHAKRIATAQLPADLSAAGQSFWSASKPLLQRHFGPGLPFLLILGIAGQWPLFNRTGLAGRLLVLYGAALAIVYPALGVAFSAWYIIPVVVSLLFGISFSIGAAGAALASIVKSRKLADYGRSSAMLVLIVMVLTSIWPRGFNWYRRAARPLHFAGHRAAGLWIRNDSLPSDAIGYVEIGAVAYYSQRTVEDLIGLVTPRSVPFVAAADLEGAFLAKPARYVILRPTLAGFMGQIAHRRWFRRNYEEVVRFHPNSSDWTAVYRRKAGAKLPSPRAPKRRYP